MTDRNKELAPDAYAAEKAPFEVVYKKYFSIIYAFCYSLIRQEQDSEDITTETFLKLYKLYDKFQTEVNIRGFLYTASRNGCMDYFRQMKKEYGLRAMVKINLEADEYTRINDELDGMHYERIWQAIEKLPDRKKEIIFKLYLEEKDHLTVAKEMEVKLNTVYSLHSRAISLLREIISSSGFTEGVLTVTILHYTLQFIA
jgi:RNA polymerase sigma-70 factor (ECF subfamily)